MTAGVSFLGLCHSGNVTGRRRLVPDHGSQGAGACLINYHDDFCNPKIKPQSSLRITTACPGQHDQGPTGHSEDAKRGVEEETRMS